MLYEFIRRVRQSYSWSFRRLDNPPAVTSASNAPFGIFISKIEQAAGLPRTQVLRMCLLSSLALRHLSAEYVRDPCRSSRNRNLEETVGGSQLLWRVSTAISIHRVPPPMSLRGQSEYYDIVRIGGSILSATLIFRPKQV
jgi:hypothetical protein